MGEKPATNIRIGNVKAAVWKHTSENGRPYSVTQFTRSYLDSDEQWKESNSFATDDLPKLELAARKAFEFAHGEMLESEKAEGQGTFQEKVSKSRSAAKGKA